MMCRLTPIARWILLLIIVGTTPLAATAQPPMQVQWPQNSINWSQLQNIFSSYPGVNQFNIQFPNSANWNVNASQMQSFYNNYMQQAGNLGYGAQSIPTLSFSSLPGAGGINAGKVTIPIQNAVSGMEYQANNGLQQLRQQISAQSNFLQNSLNHIEDNVAATYAALPAWLRNGLETLWGYIVAAGSYLYSHVNK